jgi:hypothetical protein
MLQTNRDRSLVEHLKLKVMGWHRDGAAWWTREGGLVLRGIWDTWNPLEPSAATWMVWERAREMGIDLYLHAPPRQPWEAFQEAVLDVPDMGRTADSGPRAICEAIGKATGFVDDTAKTSE